MPTPDNDKNSAVQKVVDAFRARRAGESDPVDTAAPDEGAETPVVQIQPGEAPGGGDSESPTKAFAIPTAAAATDDAEPAESADEQVDVPATQDADADTADADTADSDTDADDDAEAAAEADTDEAAAARGETPVVAIAGSGERAQTPTRRAVESVDPDATPRAPIVEHGVALDAEDPDEDTPDETADDSAETEVIDVAAAGAAVAAAAAGATAANASAATEQIAVPAEVAAATQSGEQGWSTTAHQPEVIPPAAAADAPAKDGKSRAGLWAAVIVAVLVVAGVLTWFFAFNESDQDKVADVAEQYQTAMAEGDLETLKAITCGEQYATYSTISPEDFAKAFQSQKDRNQMMLFKDINAVAIDGDVARVGVDVYSTDDPDNTTSAQVTLNKVDGEWKVCAKP
ncbi:nuclear transport factor 2 family protein [Gordonia phosphorivorans]|uniref:Nuclear transport factor 2 family protein n=1 Tax=Gordonia phosphorivorans TaxID=1056982 RepID=A0ABV6H774_9ACTN